MHATIAPAHVCAAVSILRKEPQLSPDITLSIALDVLAAWHKPLLDSDSWSLFCQRLLRHVYDLTAPDPAVLNHAKPGSNTVYGELEPKTVSRLAAEAQITAESTFVDLGSGIGNVVLQVALEAGCRCYGWEVVPERAAVAQCMLRHFTALVDFFGLRVGEVCLIHGSFLDSAATWLHCTHIFSNNLKFTPELLDNMKTLLQTCPEGTQLITTKTLSGVERKGRVVRVNERTSWDIGAILVTRSLVGTWDSVSWTPTPVEFFLSTVDRKALDCWRSKIVEDNTLWEQVPQDEPPEQRWHRVPYDPAIAESELGHVLAKDSVFSGPQEAVAAAHRLCEAMRAPLPRYSRNGKGRIVLRCTHSVRNDLYQALCEQHGVCPFLVVLTYAHPREQWAKLSPSYARRYCQAVRVGTFMLIKLPSVLINL